MAVLVKCHKVIGGEDGVYGFWDRCIDDEVDDFVEGGKVGEG